MLTHLVGHDAELAAQLLDENVINTEQLLDAVTGQRGNVLEQIGPLLLDRGADPGSIAAHAGLPVGASYGTGTSLHERLLRFFQELGDRVPALLPVAKAGQTQQAELLAKAAEQEHQERVRGR